MSYLQLKQRVGRKLFGLSVGFSTEQEAELQDIINAAALELYTMSDLEDALREQTFDSSGERYLALPYYVGNVRAIRAHCGTITLHDRRPKYHDKQWRGDNPMTFRVLGYSPLIQALTDAVPLTVQFDGTLDEPLVVKFSGTTATANVVESTVTIGVDGTASGTVANYTDIQSITKDRVTDKDVVILDADDETVSVIPNNQLFARYQILELGESNLSGCGCTTSNGRDFCLDVLYKLAYQPMINDSDTFVVPNFEDAIYYKVLERRMLDTASPDELQVVGAMHQKAKMLAENASDDHQRGRTLELKIGRNRFSMGRNSKIGRWNWYNDRDL